MSSFRTQEKLGLSNRMSLVGPCSLYGKLYDLGDYPGFKLDSTTKQLVSAELYRFSDEKILSVLDEFEGYKASNEEGSLYKRALIKLQESSITAWVYLYNRAVLESNLIESGSWEQSLLSKNLN